MDKVLGLENVILKTESTLNQEEFKAKLQISRKRAEKISATGQQIEQEFAGIARSAEKKLLQEESRRTIIS